jgi:hypothetical protein
VGYKRLRVIALNDGRQELEARRGSAMLIFQKWKETPPMKRLAE